MVAARHVRKTSTNPLQDDMIVQIVRMVQAQNQALQNVSSFRKIALGADTGMKRIEASFSFLVRLRAIRLVAHWRGAQSRALAISVSKV